MRRFICLTSLATNLLFAPSLFSPAAIGPALADPILETDPIVETDPGLENDAADHTAAKKSLSAPPFSNDSENTSIANIVQLRWLITLSCLLASGAISWGIYRHIQQQQWQHIEFLRRTIKEFEQDPEIYKALKILDFEEYRDYQISPNSGSNNDGVPISFHITDELLCNALAHHDYRVRLKHQIDHNDLDPADLRQYQIETALRDWFNKMLNGLEHFGYFIESGLFTVKELEPWLRYWVKLIADPVYRRPGSSSVYDALYSYIHNSGFFGVQKLFEKFGYRILPSPYRDNDLTKIKRSDKFDTRTALVLAKASYLAYQDKQFVAEVVQRWGNTLQRQNRLQEKEQNRKSHFVRNNFRYFNNKGRDTQAYMFRTDKFVVLAFRGSQEPKDWLTNVTAQLRNFTIQKKGATALSSYQGRVHTGFFLAWSSIENAVLAQINRWKTELADQGKPLPPLYITGHSLGGALATMAAAALSEYSSNYGPEYGIELAGVYTFGQPRVGDRTFTRQLNRHIKGKVFRFVNNNDIVPHVPPPFSILNPTRLYSHIGTVKYFNGGGNIVANSKHLTRFIDSSWSLLKSEVGAGLDLITDHKMEYYISHLDKALQEEAENQAAQMLEIN